ncbi:hypothetical protein BDCR2A_02058 [Borrelia duttonii CR2A]|uniref:Uncharacterized protein n=1 Tax=Borrelia duttonii CR2A TaxID=1432657 RepID=W6TFK3_9SPIR|nr:hypothetical protein BDCR2A_02058 [Borrelia duttonii CR2A]
MTNDNSQKYLNKDDFFCYKFKNTKSLEFTSIHF